MIAQALNDGMIASLNDASLKRFTDGEEEFGDHMPVDTAESFVLIEGAGSSGEGMMVEDGFIEVFELLRQVIGIAVLGIEMDTTVAILFEDRAEILVHDG